VVSTKSDPLLSNYRLVDRLGQGGMGVVYRGEDELLRRPVALKFLTGEGEGDERQRARFLREARTAASLNHANICTIYHVGQIDVGVELRPDADGPSIPGGTPYIAMELIAGETLPAPARASPRGRWRSHCGLIFPTSRARRKSSAARSRSPAIAYDGPTHARARSV
jgi:serine/threonine protein kinase